MDYLLIILFIKFGFELFKYFYTTVGNGTSVANSKQFAQEFSKELLENKVDAVILTST